MSTTKELAKQSNLDGNVAGGSGGALLILIAQSLPPDSGISQVLIYSAPFFGVGLSAFWIWAKNQIDKWSNDRQFKKYISDCKEFLEISLKDPNLSEDRKSKLRQLYDELNHLTASMHFGKIKSIKFEKEFKTIIDAIDETMEGNITDVEHEEVVETAARNE